MKANRRRAAVAGAVAYAIWVALVCTMAMMAGDSFVAGLIVANVTLIGAGILMSVTFWVHDWIYKP